jgi:hypothetical protein
MGARRSSWLSPSHSRDARLSARQAARWLTAIGGKETQASEACGAVFEEA